MFDDVHAPLSDPSLPEHEQVVARSSLTDAVAGLTVDEFWITVRRGTAELDPATFLRSDHDSDHCGFVPLRSAQD
jgi:hypothetical protein